MWEFCENNSIWTKKVMQKKGLRNPSAKHIDQQEVDTPFGLNEGEYEVEEIIKQKVKKGKTMYLVKWKGYEEATWVPAGELNADEIIEDWEIQNNVDNDNGESVIKYTD